VTSAATKVKNPRPRRRLRKAPVPGGKGDAARSMFARWAKEHHDLKPVRWEQLQAVLEKNRLREAPLFGHD
jgi:hypothetical protein